MARRGTKLPPLPRDVMRMYREYRTGLRELRMEALLRQKLRLLDGEEMPMTEEEYQLALGEMRQEEELLRADREDLERELARRPSPRLPPAGSLVLDAESSEAPPPAREQGHAQQPPAARAPAAPAEPPADLEPPAAGPATVAEGLEPDEDDVEGGWM